MYFLLSRKPWTPYEHNQITILYNHLFVLVISTCVPNYNYARIIKVSVSGNFIQELSEDNAARRKGLIGEENNL